MYPSKYLRGQDFGDYVMLAKVVGVEQREMIARRGAKPEMSWVLFVTDETPGTKRKKFTTVVNSQGVFSVILRKKLAEEIAAVIGAWQTEDWTNQYIVLYAIDEKAKGQKVRSVWVRKPVSAKSGAGKTDEGANGHESNNRAGGTVDAGSGGAAADADSRAGDDDRDRADAGDRGDGAA
jgi:ribulose bisphosphate carboxylase small subunit